MNTLRDIYRIAIREIGIMRRNFIYPFCMIVFPVVVVVFFTTLMKEGVPCDMPVGVVDQDNTAMTRSITRQLDASQTSRVVAGYENVDAAREAIQKGEIYAFIYFPKGTESGVMRGDRPTVSYYYSNVTLVAGSMTFRDLEDSGYARRGGSGHDKACRYGHEQRRDKRLSAAYQRRSAHDRQSVVKL